LTKRLTVCHRTIKTFNDPSFIIPRYKEASGRRELALFKNSIFPS